MALVGGAQAGERRLVALCFLAIFFYFTFYRIYRVLTSRFFLEGEDRTGLKIACALGAVTIQNGTTAAHRRCLYAVAAGPLLLPTMVTCFRFSHHRSHLLRVQCCHCLVHGCSEEEP